MKHIFLFLLAALMLCGCNTKPVLREGYYLLPLEESENAPVYFCLESNGGGYFHAMGVDAPLSWTPEGLGEELSPGVVTKKGLEFRDGEAPLIFTYSRKLPESYHQGVLQPGFYIPAAEEHAALMCCVQLRDGGTGDFFFMGTTEPIKWEPTRLTFRDLIVPASRNGFTLAGDEPVVFTYTGETLPEGYGYLPDPTAPGVCGVVEAESDAFR